MFIRFLIIIFIFSTISSCSKKKETIDNSRKLGYVSYEKALYEMNNGEFFLASKLFDDSELNIKDLRFAAKSAILSSYCLYRINFYEQSLEKLNRFIGRYPVDTNIPYAHYLSAVISFEQILDEKKDLKPVIVTKEKILEYIKKFPDTEYALDLKFKLDLVNNQLAAKEIYIARYYIKTNKWIPAINRLKLVVEKYSETVFIEEALHRLVEVYYKIGLENEAKNTAQILGYNYNSSEWYKKSYSILNKDYKIERNKIEQIKQKEDGLIKKIIEKITS